MRLGVPRPYRNQPTTSATPSTIAVGRLNLGLTCVASCEPGVPIEHSHRGTSSGRIPATGVPGMAATDPADSAPTPGDGTALLHAFDKILAATGHKPAVVPQPWTDQPLIDPDCRHQSPAGPQPRAPHPAMNPLAPGGRRHARGSCLLQPGWDIDLSRFKLRPLAWCLIPGPRTRVGTSGNCSARKKFSAMPPAQCGANSGCWRGGVEAATVPRRGTVQLGVSGRASSAEAPAGPGVTGPVVTGAGVTGPEAAGPDVAGGCAEPWPRPNLGRT